MFSFLNLRNETLLNATLANAIPEENIERIWKEVEESKGALSLLYNPDPLLIGLYVPVFVLSIAANALLITVVFKYHYMRNVTNIFLVNLSAADLLVTLLCMPVQIGKAITLVWFYGEFMCKMVNYLQGVAVAASVFTLAAMSVDRYLAIAQCMRAPRSSGRRVWHRALLAVLWAVALTIFAPVLAVAVLKVERVPVLKYTLNGTIIDDELIDFCTEEWPQSTVRRELFGTFSFILVYAIPGIIMVVAYSLMGKRLCSVKPPFDHEDRGANTQQGHRLVRERKRVAWILLLLAVLFAVCWLPYNIMQLLLDTSSISIETISDVLPYALFLGHANSAVNPIVYCLMTRNFRRSLKKLLCRPTTDLANRRHQRFNVRCIARDGTSSSAYDSHHEPHRKCYLKMSSLRRNMYLESSLKTGTVASQMTTNSSRTSRRLMHSQPNEILQKTNGDLKPTDSQPQFL